MAAGSGTRLGAAVPKAFADLLGEPILDHAVRGVRDVPAIRHVVLVVPTAFVEEIRARYAGQADLSVVAGGLERSHSVAAGLATLDPGTDVVLVHDAARCLTPPAVFTRVIDAVRGGFAGAVPGVPVVDTIKVVDERGVITQTPERSRLRAVQTPQGFRLEALRAAYASGLTATDDAALVEQAGHEVVVVEGDPRAFKITTPEDLERAVRILAT